MKRSESERRQRPFYTVLRNGHRPPVLFLGFSIKSASWLPFVPVFPEGPPAPAHAHSLAEDWRTLQVGCRAAGRQAGRHESRRGMQRRRPASLGREVAVARGNAAHRCSLLSWSVGRSVGYNRRRGEQESGNAASYLPCRWRCYPLYSAPSLLLPLQQF